MSKIKIISDPYKNTIQYKIYTPSTASWDNVDSGSKLKNQKYTTGVFPFIIKQVVDIILEDYREGNKKIEIDFEGTTDEFEELRAVCYMPEYKDVILLRRSGLYLKNAREIHDEVKHIFEEMMPLVSDTVRNNENLDDRISHFNDVSKDTIPLCIIGNYSAGKSTFINALIGNEILPSADESLTARIHQISRTVFNSEEATIDFEYNNSPVSIRFDEKTQTLETQVTSGLFITELKECLDECKALSVTERVNSVLTKLNYYDKTYTDDNNISDVIKISVPFHGKGSFGRSTRDYVIFDTPGSNSASNHKHLEVLKKQMQGLSNGLLIYVTQKDDLDSKDNEALCLELNSMDELDTRFTLIVVNRADEANLPKEGHFSDESIETMLRQSIPNALYAEGMFFVSSIIALGAKTNGHFIDEHYDRVFHRAENDYSDPTSRYYMQLYRYNIMPEQIKEKALSFSENSDDMLLSNSGMLWVEREIEVFSEKYSSYNKCDQSKKYIDQVVRITEESLNQKKRDCADSKRQRNEALDKNSEELIKKLEIERDKSERLFINNYKTELSRIVFKEKKLIKVSELEEIEKSIQEEYREKYINNPDKKRSDVDEDEKKIEQLNFDSFDLDTISKNANVVKNAIKVKLQRVRKDIKDQNEVYDAIVKMTTTIIKRKFENNLSQIQNEMNSSSKEYWLKNTDGIKEKLSDIVQGNVGLPPEQRQEITKIILSDDTLSFEEEIDEIFQKSKFEKKPIKIFNLILFRNPNVKKSKMVDTYNNELETRLNEIRMSIQEKYLECFRKWLSALITRITENIADYSPELQTTIRLINEDERRMFELEAIEAQLRSYVDRLGDLMEWKSDS